MMGVAVVADPRIGIESGILRIGQRITIVAGLPGGEPEDYPSRIEDVLKDAVTVSMPMKRGDLVPLPPNTEVLVRFRQGDVGYRFSATVDGWGELPFPVLYLVKVRELSKEERRAHVRIDVLFEPEELLLAGEENGEESRAFAPVVTNISAGGLELVCRKPLAVGCTVHIAFNLRQGFGRIRTAGQVVRCQQAGESALRKWRIGIAFRDMGDEQRDRVAAFVLYQQQILRRRGLM